MTHCHTFDARTIHAKQLKDHFPPMITRFTTGISGILYGGANRRKKKDEVCKYRACNVHADRIRKDHISHTEGQKFLVK